MPKLSSPLRAALHVTVFAALLSACAKDVVESDLDPFGHRDEMPDAGSPADDSDEERDAAVLPALPVQPAQPSIVQHCVGTRRTCASYDQASHCTAQGCNWAQCTGAATNCWDGTGAGSEIRLCEQLAPYCQVIDDEFFGPVCQSAEAFSVAVPCSAFEKVDGPSYACWQAGCSWSDEPTCTGDVVACSELAVEDCQEETGCRLVEQTEASCVGSPCQCAAGLESCQDTCVDTQTSPLHCGACGVVCDEGSVCSDGACRDIDECAQGTGLCPEHTDCRNTAPGYTCDCQDGYEGEGCTNIDECTTGHHTCSVDADCFDTDGSYRCACRDGYSGDGVTCTDVDECVTNPCGPHGVCTNAPGGYSCECAAGYVWPLAGGECLLEDGCVAAGLSCDANASCESDPAYACVCHDGYHGDGESCTDDDECAAGVNPCGPNSLCTNQPGAYACECKPGYGRSSGGDCDVVVDECMASEACHDIGTCSTGLDGAYVCECLPGSPNDSCGTWLDSEFASAHNGYLLRGAIAGFWFRAPFDFRIIGGRAPTRSPDFVGQRGLTFYRLNELGVQTNDFQILGGGQTTDAFRTFDIEVKEGDYIGVIAKQQSAQAFELGKSLLSFVGGTYNTSMDGHPVTLRPLEAVYTGLRFEGLHAWNGEAGRLHRGHAQLMWKREPSSTTP